LAFSDAGKAKKVLKRVMSSDTEMLCMKISRARSQGDGSMGKLEFTGPGAFERELSKNGQLSSHEY
jgi:hypothetical protein